MVDCFEHRVFCQAMQKICCSVGGSEGAMSAILCLKFF